MSPPPHLQGFPATVGQRAEGVPLVADLLAPGVDIVGVVVIQLAAGQAESNEAWQGQLVGGLDPSTPRIPRLECQGSQHSRISTTNQSPLGSGPGYPQGRREGVITGLVNR